MDLNKLSEQEQSLIASALNAYWNDAQDQLSNGGSLSLSSKRLRLGDVAKALLKQRVELVKPLIAKFE